jgi:tetratricopeptide repeat protein
VLAAHGDFKKAVPLVRRVITIQEKNLGPLHPDLAASLQEYAILLGKTKRKAEALEMEERANGILSFRSSQDGASLVNSR